VDQKKNILIVEDEQALLRSLAFTLKRHHYCVLEACNGIVAFTALTRYTESDHSLDLLITDIQLPGISGLELIDRIRNMGLTFPIMVITAYGDRSIKNELEKRGITCYLCKPFTTEELLLKVTEILEQ
jgi:two-component system response regulator FlrC